MDAKTYLKISMINLAFLLVGIIMGASLVIFATSVHAQDKTTKSNAKLESPSGFAAVPDPKFEYVSPTMSAGSAAFETLIAHRIASDQLMVNGYDLLKLDDSILGVLISKSLLSPDQARNLAESSKVDRPLRLQPLRIK